MDAILRVKFWYYRRNRLHFPGYYLVPKLYLGTAQRHGAVNGELPQLPCAHHISNTKTPKTMRYQAKSAKLCRRM